MDTENVTHTDVQANDTALQAPIMFLFALVPVVCERRDSRVWAALYASP